MFWDFTPLTVYVVGCCRHQKLDPKIKEEMDQRKTDAVDISNVYGRNSNGDLADLELSTDNPMAGGTDNEKKDNESHIERGSGRDKGINMSNPLHLKKSPS